MVVLGEPAVPVVEEGENKSCSIDLLEPNLPDWNSQRPNWNSC